MDRKQRVKIKHQRDPSNSALTPLDAHADHLTVHSQCIRQAAIRGSGRNKQFREQEQKPPCFFEQRQEEQNLQSVEVGERKADGDASGAGSSLSLRFPNTDGTRVLAPGSAEWEGLGGRRDLSFC